METTQINVGGMTCGGCERSVTKAIEQLPGVREVTADHGSGVVTIAGEPVPGRDLLKQAVEDAGYEVLPEGKRPLPMA